MIETRDESSYTRIKVLNWRKFQVLNDAGEATNEASDEASVEPQARPESSTIQEPQECEEQEEPKKGNDDARVLAELFNFCKMPGLKAKIAAIEDLLRQGICEDAIRGALIGPECKSLDFFVIMRAVRESPHTYESEYNEFLIRWAQEDRKERVRKRNSPYCCEDGRQDLVDAVQVCEDPASALSVLEEKVQDATLTVKCIYDAAAELYSEKPGTRFTTEQLFDGAMVNQRTQDIMIYLSVDKGDSVGWPGLCGYGPIAEYVARVRRDAPVCSPTSG